VLFSTVRVRDAEQAAVIGEASVPGRVLAAAGDPGGDDVAVLSLLPPENARWADQDRRRLQLTRVDPWSGRARWVSALSEVAPWSAHASWLAVHGGRVSVLECSGRGKPGCFPSRFEWSSGRQLPAAEPPRWEGPHFAVSPRFVSSSGDGRLVLGEQRNESQRWFTLLDVPAVKWVAQFSASCARLDVQGRLHVDRAVNAQALGVMLRGSGVALGEPLDGCAAHETERTHATGASVTEAAVSLGDYIAWEAGGDSLNGLFLLALDSAALPHFVPMPPPASLAASPLQIRADDVHGQFIVAKGSSIYTLDPVSGRLQARSDAGNGFPFYVQGERWLVDRGMRFFAGTTLQSTAKEPIALRYKGWAPRGMFSIEDGRPMFTYTDATVGVEHFDATTGRPIYHLCGAQDPLTHNCSETFLGLTPTSDGAHAWLLHTPPVPRGQGSFGKSEVAQLVLATGQLAARLPAPDFAYLQFQDVLLDDRTLVYPTETCAGGAVECPLAQVDLSPQVAGSGRYHQIALLPGGRLGHALNKQVLTTTSSFQLSQGNARWTEVAFFTRAGRRLLSVGTDGHEGWAQTPDGRFACAGIACERLRCIVGQQPRPATDMACAGLRRPGFRLRDEVERAQ
jgi:hypothetical protein